MAMILATYKKDYSNHILDLDSWLPTAETYIVILFTSKTFNHKWDIDILQGREKKREKQTT